MNEELWMVNFEIERSGDWVIERLKGGVLFKSPDHPIAQSLNEPMSH